MEFRLLRFSQLNGATLGMLMLDGFPMFATLEPLWLDNASCTSCIPAGKYTCSKYASKKFGQTYIVNNVFGREGVLFHAGNTTKDTQGCILLGQSFGVIDKLPAVRDSREAIKRFLNRLLITETFALTIDEAYAK